MKDKRKKSEESEKKEPQMVKKRYESETSESEPNVAPKKTLKEKLSTFKVRVISSVIMVLGFIAIIAAGHFYCGLLVIIINVCIFKELISLKRNEQREAKLPYFSFICWYFFLATEIVMTFLFVSQKIIKSQTIDVSYI